MVCSCFIIPIFEEHTHILENASASQPGHTRDYNYSSLFDMQPLGCKNSGVLARKRWTCANC